MIGDLIDVFQFIGAVFRALFNIFDFLNFIISMVDFFHWCSDKITGFFHRSNFAGTRLK